MLAATTEENLLDYQLTADDIIHFIHTTQDCTSPTATLMEGHLRLGGISAEGPATKSFEGRYIGLRDLETGRLIGVAGHYWDGKLLILWPNDQTRSLAVVLTTFAADGAFFSYAECPSEMIFSVRAHLEHVLPHSQTLPIMKLFDIPSVIARIPFDHEQYLIGSPVESELPQLVNWRVDFLTKSAMDIPADRLALARSRSIAYINSYAHEDGMIRVLRHRSTGEMLAMLTLFALTQFAVLLANVFVPKENRRRGFARQMLIGVLTGLFQDRNVQTAVLYTDTPEAVSLYESIGFKTVDRLYYLHR